MEKRNARVFLFFLGPVAPKMCVCSEKRAYEYNKKEKGAKLWV